MSARIRLAALASVVGAIAIGPAVPAQEQEDVVRREEYFRRQLAYPNRDVPEDAIRRLVQLSIERARAGTLANSALNGSFLPLGPAGILPTDGYYMSGNQLDAGRVSGIAIDYDGDTWYVATAGGGVWKTTNSGASWMPLTDHSCSLNTGAIAVNHLSGVTSLYAGTGELNSGSLGCGILRSVDGGSTWFPSSTWMTVANRGGLKMPIGVIYVAGRTVGDNTTVLLGGGFGVYRSEDSGVTWVPVLPAADATIGRVDAIVAHPRDTTVIYAGVGDGSRPNTSAGVYRSTDMGLTWTALPLPPGITRTSVARFALATSPAAPDKVWVVAASNVDRKLLGVFVWDEIARQWTTLNMSGLYIGARGNFGAQSDYDLVLAVDRNDAQTIFAAGVRMYRSRDGGASWRQVANDIHVDWHALAFDPHDSRRIVAGSDGGVYLTLDGGDSWTSRNYGLAITQYYPGVSIHPTDPTIVIGGSQDNGSHRSYGMPVWEGISGGDGGYTAINSTNPGIIWTTCQWGSRGPCIFRGNAAGWDFKVDGIQTYGRAEFIPPLVMDPTTPTTLYFGTMQLYRTMDDGATPWLPISPDLSKGSGDISAIAPVNGAMIYVGTSDGNVRVSRDSGKTWDAVGSGLPNLYVSSIVVDPANPLRAWAAHAGFGPPHVFVTTDGGTTWSSVSGNLPDLPVYSIVYIASQNVLVIGTYLGVYESADGGTTWTPGPAGIPLVRVRSLAYNATTATLVAATHGRGMFKLQLGATAPVLRGDVNRDGRVDAADALLIQRALIGLPLGSDAGGVPYAAMPRGDANCNGVLEAVDALITLRFAVGLPVTGCVNTSAARAP